MTGVSEIALNAGWIATAIGGALVAGETTRGFGGVSIDSRTLVRDELYIAIRGQRFDGADFAEAAVAAGAAGVVVPRGRGRDIRPGPVVIEVDDTTAALQALAARVRSESGTAVVAITGSAGKTTTKEIAAEFLAARYRTFRNRGNLNNHIGLPLSLIELRRRPDIAVVELGMSQAGEISTLMRIADPNVRVWTNVGDAHLGFFASVEALTDAKAEILEGASPSTLLVANADDERVMARVHGFGGRLMTFGIQHEADVRASDIKDRGIDGIRAKVSTPRGSFDLETRLLGRGNLANVLAATAVALHFDVPTEAIAQRTKQLAPAPHRGEIVRLPNGVTVVDDSYNASPAATKQALDHFQLARGRRVAVLGEMLELGMHAGALHEEVGQLAAARVDLLITVGGPAAEALGNAAVRTGLSRERVHHFGTSDEAAGAVVGLIQPGDMVLVKGSRGIGVDRVVARLRQEHR